MADPTASPDQQACPSCGAMVARGARFCPNCGAPIAAGGAEERKLATILFADVSGSTDLGEQLDPERMRALLSEYFAAMAAVIGRWGGTVEKYIGDAVVAVFGVPAAREDDAARALHAALDMLDALAQLNDGFETRHGVRLGIRIGVNSGEVLVPAGGRSGGQGLASGDAVNVAARLQQSADVGSVLVGERTWSAARDAFSFGKPIELSVKGKREPVVARRLGLPIAGEQRGVRFAAPMVGRERELQTLLGLLDEAVDNATPRLAVISGSAGIGKSRLLREFVAAAGDAHPASRVLRGRCLAAGHGITFWALGEILRAAGRISLDEPSESAAEKLRSTLDALLGPLNLAPTEREETLHALAMTANLTLAGNPLARLAPDEVGDAIARAWPRFLAALALESPLMVLIEDLHWADDRLVGLVELLGARSTGRLLLLATARPEFLESHRDFAANVDMTVLSLRPLTETQSDRLVAELLGDSDALAALLADVRHKADGNPFFLEEILQRLIDEGAIVNDGGRWRATERAASVRLPDTIHAVLAARIDALPAPEKAVLQQAAVVGRTFWPGSLGTLGNAGDVLRAVERRGLITARPTSTVEGETEYMFRHVLIRDVAYASVPKARRARAHAETANWIERLAGDRAEEFGELLAYHYAAAAAGEDADLAWADAPAEREELRRRAFDTLVRAGDAARHRFAIDKALMLHGQALDLASGDAELARAHEALGDDHDALFHMDEAVSHYFDAVDAVQRGGVGAARIAALAAKLATSAQRWGAFKQAPPFARIRRLVDEALAIDVGEVNRAEVLIASASLGRRGLYRSSHEPLTAEDRADLPQAIASAEEGLAIARRIDDPSLIWRATATLSLLYWQNGDYDRARAMTESQLDLVDRLPSRRQKVGALDELAMSRVQSGRYEEGLATAERAFDLAAEVSPHERMHTSFTLMLVLDALGMWDRVDDVLTWHAQAAAAEPAVKCPNVRGGGPLGATILIRRGEVGRALELVPVDESALDRNTLFDRALIDRYAALIGQTEFAGVLTDSIQAQGDRLRWPDGLDAFVEALALLGRHQEVEQLLPALREQAIGDVKFQAVADRVEAELLISRGEPKEARRLLERALAWFDDKRLPFEAALTRELLAKVSSEEDASVVLRSALAAYEQLGAEPYVERVREALALTAPANWSARLS